MRQIKYQNYGYFIICLFTLLIPNICLANTNLGADANVLTIGKTLNLVLSLVGILVVILILAFILRKILNARSYGVSGMRILTTLTVGSKERIILVDAQGTLILMGVTPQQISTLHVFDESAIDLVKNLDTPTTQRSFKSIWRSQRNQFEDKKK